ncbi:4-nitrophenylphosphatase [Schizosaccharomyces japonicus yFS275]|uniref:4-nitrophenylphosphatase n=1 Tax=Schizosaccharomyces japonicus (strain yFS275 / FY16936) TaxID=402676 RepID=B6K3C4_SCHJY|nr:4-nitrophenylphosphatase [Schizosaccharomyces japonicus yFS275]EEB07981.1 4-nitrophenylphosphatase [Schizosaccharomyces japonicus yFS275]
MAQHLSNVQEYKEFLDKFDVFLFDCDGVIWHGKNPIPQVKETLDLMRSMGKRLFFVSNNSTKSRQTYLKKITDLGIEANLNEIYPSAYSSAVYIKKVLKLPSDKKVFVFGEKGIEEELDEVGVAHIGGTDPSLNRNITSADMDTIRPDPSVGAVLCGMDTKLNYLKYCMAFQYIQDPNCAFLLTNQDSTFPTNGTFFPGSGAVSYPLIFSSGRTPKILGKPYGEMMDAIEAGVNFDRKRACFVGDRLNTDIQFAKNSGLGGSLLVLTGVNQLEHFQGKEDAIVPDYYIESLGHLAQAASL